MSRTRDSHPGEPTAVRRGTCHAPRGAVRASFPLLCLGLLAMPRPASCSQGRLAPGARVRLDVPSAGRRYTGTFVALESDTLVMVEDEQAPGLRLIVPADSIALLEVRGERSMTLEGAGLGLLGGTFLALVATPDCEDENGESTVLACLAYKVSPDLDTRLKVFGLVGTLVGVIAGSETKTHTWLPVHLNGLDIHAAPDGGIALGLRISF